MVLGVAGLGSAATLGYGAGATLLVVGTLLLPYNLLLSSVKDNNGAGVFKIIKVGCLIVLYLELVDMLVMVFMGLVTLADRGSIPILAVELVGFFVDIFLTSLAIFGIHSAKPKIVSLFIYIKFILFLIMIILFWVLLFLVAFCRVDAGDVDVFFGDFFAAFYGVGPIAISSLFAIIIVVWIMDYYFKLFALHVNMMTNAQVTYNLHHQELNNF